MNLTPTQQITHVGPASPMGVYTPVIAEEALLTFFMAQPGNFGPLHPVESARTQQPGEALMNSLPMASSGYLLRNTITLLFNIYAHANQLLDGQFVRSDEVMDLAFGGEIPAAFYSYRGANGKIIKVSMEQALAQGLLTAPLNTYQVIQALYPNFNPQRFETYFYQHIAAANFYSEKDLAADPNLVRISQYLQQEDVRQAMLQEHQIVKEVSAEWNELLKPMREEQRNIRMQAWWDAKRDKLAARQ